MSKWIELLDTQLVSENWRIGVGNDNYLGLEKATHSVSENIVHFPLGEGGVPGPSWLFVRAAKSEAPRPFSNNELILLQV